MYVLPIRGYLSLSRIVGGVARHLQNEDLHWINGSRGGVTNQ